jgi:predicted ATPase/KaiC/GvpD/RAD55 family RecA-like ATPase
LTLTEDRLNPNSFFERKQTSLVNRIQEMTLLRGLADKATEGEGAVFFLFGEAGIGKTRLTKEIKPHADSHGMRILYGRCPAVFQTSSGSPYAVWKEIIRDYIRKSTDDQLQRVAGSNPVALCKLIPEATSRLHVSEPANLREDLEHERLFEGISEFFRNISETEPLIIVLDDLQWSDKSSLLLLHYLSHLAYRENILFLGAYRDTELDKKHPLSEMLTELNRARLAQSTQLKRLPYPEVVKIVEQLVGFSNLSRDFYSRVFEKTNGNPFFIEEVIASLKEQGIIFLQGNKLAIGDFSKIQFPQTVKDILKERIDRLDEDCQNILLTASLIGNDFNFQALLEILQINEAKLTENIETMIRAGLLKSRIEKGENICSFSDSLVRDLLNEEEIGPFKRKSLHSKIANSLEKIYAKTIDDHLGELASHFLAGGDKEKAFAYYAKAAKKAREIYANNEASAYYQSALEIAEQTTASPKSKIILYEQLGDTLCLLGEYSKGIDIWNKTLNQFGSREHKVDRARIHRKIAQVLWSKNGLPKKAEEHQTQALSLLAEIPTGKEIADLKADIARMHLRFGDTIKAAAAGEEALKISSEVNDCEGIANSCITLGAVLTLQGDRVKATQYLEKALSVSLEKGCLENAVYAYDNLGFALVRTTQRAKQLEYYQKGFDLAKKIGAVSAQTWIGNNLSDMLIGMGNINEASEIKQDCVSKDRRTGNLVNLAFSLAGLGYIYQILGNLPECERILIEAKETAEKTTDLPAYGFAVYKLSNYYIETRQFDKTKKIISESYTYVKENSAKVFEVIVNDISIRVLLGEGKFGEAEDFVNRQHLITKELDDKEYVAFTDASKAVILSKQGKMTQALELFEKSIQQLEEIDEKKWSVYEYSKRVLFEYSRVLVERNTDEDKQKAVLVLNQALDLFEKVTAKSEIEKVRTILATIQGTKQVEIKPESNQPTRVPTGNPKLDTLLFGGIPAQYSVALTASSCDARDSTIEAFLNNGLDNNEITFYVTEETSLANKLAQKHSKNLWVFLCNIEAKNTPDSSQNKFILNGVGNLTELSITLTQAIQNLKAQANAKKRICIDITSDILLQHHAVSTRKWLTEITTMLKSKGFTILTVIDPMIHPLEELYAVLGVFDGEINIRQSETNNGLATFLRIKRMRDSEFVKTEIPV